MLTEKKKYAKRLDLSKMHYRLLLYQSGLRLVRIVAIFRPYVIVFIKVLELENGNSLPKQKVVLWQFLRCLAAAVKM